MALFKTVLPFTFVEELVVVRARLESEGIMCFTQNEHTTQVDNFMSNAVNGILLQVRTEDHPRAVQLLKEWGEWPKEEVISTSSFWLSFDRFTNRIPHFNRLDVLIRFFVLVTLAVSLLFITPYLLLNY